jgi:8-oxo-dGTP pyrophosphatase MutT (NUDIX family)
LPTHALEKRIEEALRRRTRHEITTPEFRRAAVLVPLYRVEGEHRLLLTRRSERVTTHQGQICFPGGSIDPGDSDALAAALRETEEELGIAPADVRVLGPLDDIETVVSGFVISPFVGLIPHPYPLRPSEREIAELVRVPLATFRDRARLRTEVHPDRPYPILYYDCAPHEVWGATARIIRNFIDIAFGE